MGAGAQLACSTRSRDRSMIMTSLLVCAFLCVASSSSSLNAASLDDDVVELATYNTGLLPTIPRLGERFEALLNEVKGFFWRFFRTLHTTLARSEGRVQCSAL